MTKYSVLVDPKVAEFIKSKGDSFKNRVKEKLNLVSENPFHFLEHYEGGNYYKLRIGKYRALIDVDFDRKILFVRVFDIRGKIYKKHRH